MLSCQPRSSPFSLPYTEVFYRAYLTPYPSWAWARAADALVDRSRSPWDSEERRPSHADKRKALQREILRHEIRAVVGQRAESEEFQQLLIGLLDLAA
jgi:hypothetical protein